MKIKLTVRKLELLNRAIGQLFNLQEPIITLTTEVEGEKPQKRQEQRAKAIRLPGSTSYALRKNLRKLESILDPVEKTRQELIAKHSANGAIDLNAEFIHTEGQPPAKNQAREDFLKEINGILDSEEEVEFHEIPEAGWNLFDPKTNPDGNTIPDRILHVLEPMTK